jgi:hypothetical protein
VKGLPQKITFAEMRECGVHRLLVYCADYTCSHSIAISGDVRAGRYSQFFADVTESEIGDAFVWRAKAPGVVVGAQFGRVQASAKVSARARALLISYAAGEPRYARRICVASSSSLIHRASPPSSSSERDFCRRRLAREKGPEDDVSGQRPEMETTTCEKCPQKRPFC